jgi:hypothetical protein
MSFIKRVIHRVKRDYFRLQYKNAAKQVLATEALPQGDLPFVVLSMVHQRDVHSYLVAIKSFACFLNPKRIVVVCDPSIEPADRAVLRQQVPHIELRDAHEFTHPDIPRGGTWERLFAIASMVADDYVVQLDADTLTIRPIPEVWEAIQSGTSFVLGEQPETPLRLLPAVREYALPWIGPGAHVQAIAEVEMANVGLPATAGYIRGCSGFTGFPRSADMREIMLDYSRRMQGKLGADWKRWGTEQVTSNYIASNMPGAHALPYPKYGTPDHATAETAFFHFIGSLRFANSQYEKASLRAIRIIRGVAA